MHYFTLRWGAAGGGWTPAQPPDLILEALEQSPFVPLTAATSMDLNVLERWQPYQRDEARTLLRRGKEPLLRLRIEEPNRDGPTLIG